MYNVIVPITTQSTNNTSKEITTLGDIIQEMRNKSIFLGDGKWSVLATQQKE